MNANQIYSGLKGNQITSNDIRGIFPINLLEKYGEVKRAKNNAFVCNTAIDSHPGQHWIAIFIDYNSNGEYFDSYGQPPNEIFSRFLDKHCTEWYWNDIILQSPFSSVCGQYCMYYIYGKSCNLQMTDITEVLCEIEKKDKYVYDFVRKTFPNIVKTSIFDRSFFIEQISLPFKSNMKMY